MAWETSTPSQLTLTREIAFAAVGSAGGSAPLLPIVSTTASVAPVSQHRLGFGFIRSPHEMRLLVRISRITSSAAAMQSPEAQQDSIVVWARYPAQAH